MNELAQTPLLRLPASVAMISPRAEAASRAQLMRVPGVRTATILPGATVRATDRTQSGF
jgi:hypothetical protein